MNSRRKIKLTIVGAGISGIAQAVRLQEKLGNSVEFTIYERSNAVGGVWDHSRWPGVAVDVPVHLYSLYSHLNPSFSSKWAGGDEVLAYWKRIIVQHHLQDHFVFDTEFVSSRWNEASQSHTVLFRNLKTKETFEITTDILISATGALNKPIIPKVPGIDRFEGIQFHSSRWRTAVDLRNKKVAVVGNGSSGIQAIPNIVDLEGIEVVNFIRSPGYFRPKVNFAYSWWKKFVFRWVPFALRLYRWKIFFDYDRAVLSRGTGAFSTNLRNQTGESIISYMKSQLPEKYWKDLIPDYPLHCKRVAYDAGWLASFARDNVELVSSPIVGVSEKGLFTADGREHELDVIVWATGFEVSSTGVGLNENVFGENGRELREVWEENGGAYGYQGILVPGVPNYFVVLGPNAAAMSWGFALAHNTDLIARYIKEMYDRQLSSIVVTDSALATFNDYVQYRVQHTSWSLASCGDSWYKNKNGRVVVPAPWSATETWARTRRIKLEHFRCSRLIPSTSQVVVVDLGPSRSWTPRGVFGDFVAERLADWLEGLMTKDAVGATMEEKLVERLVRVEEDENAEKLPVL